MIPGKLEKGAVLKAICAGFEETTEPAVCLSGGKFLLSDLSQILISTYHGFGFGLTRGVFKWISSLLQKWRQMSV